jgi:hypothetical protein
MHLACDTLLPTVSTSTSGTNCTSAAKSIHGGTMRSTSSTSATNFSRWCLATSERRARLILDEAHGSLSVSGGDEHGATGSVHRLDNNGGKKRGRRPMCSCSSKKTTIWVYFPLNDLISMQKTCTWTSIWKNKDLITGINMFVDRRWNKC